MTTTSLRQTEQMGSLGPLWWKEKSGRVLLPGPKPGTFCLQRRCSAMAFASYILGRKEHQDSVCLSVLQPVRVQPYRLNPYRNSRLPHCKSCWIWGPWLWTSPKWLSGLLDGYWALPHLCQGHRSRKIAEPGRSIMVALRRDPRVRLFGRREQCRKSIARIRAWLRARKVWSL